MSSVGPTSRGFKQSAGGFFIPLGDVASRVLAFTSVGGAGGSYLTGSFARAGWAAFGTTPSPYTSTISSIAAGGLLRDMGKSVVSAGRVFRKVQLLTSTVSTSGVGGPAGVTTNPVVDYLTGYIELGAGLTNGGQPGLSFAPVAYYPGLL
jgi:hypothetical protein